MNHVIILAGGKGTRMHIKKPKCSLELLGKPMILYLLDTIEKINTDDIITVVGNNSLPLTKIIDKRSIIVKQKKPLGTADAVLAAKDKIDSDSGYTIIIKGDMPLIDEKILNGLIEKHLTEKNDLTITSIILDDPTDHARIIKKGNTFVKLKDDKDLTKKEKDIKEVNAGLYIIKNNLLFKAIAKITSDNIKGEYHLTDIVKSLKTKKIGIYNVLEYKRLLGVNDFYKLSETEDFLRKEINKNLMYKGVYIENPNTVTIGPEVKVFEGAKIYSNTKIIGNSTIGEETVIGPNSFINNSFIYNKAVVNNSVVINSIIGQGATIGPFAHIRDNSTIGANNRIGNFVEIKNSSTNANTKASHLAYIGDSTIGENVNFGCGSITVNYDGENKNRTKIGDNVFVGCNSNLIAPIKIDDNSFIAAGSTITDDLEDSDFAIARAKQVTKKGYAKKYKK